MTHASSLSNSSKRFLYRASLGGPALRVAVVSLSITTALCAIHAQTLAPADAERYIREVKTLSAPNMEGRGDGSKGLTRARDILVKRYASLGLEPKGSEGFLQPFDIITGAELTAGNRFDVEAGGLKQTLKLREDYVPFAFSAAGKSQAGLVFAGYGITAEEWKYDDYKNLDVKGKIVVLLSKEPAFASRHEPKGEPSSHADVITKAILARKHGAAAVVVVNGTLGQGEEDVLPHFGGDGGQEDIGIPIIAVKNDVAAVWFNAADKDLLALQSKIDESGDTASFAFPDSLRATLDTGIKKKHATVSNVLAYLPGKSDEYIILGAHYDHLGRGEYGGSLAPSLIGQFHPGADDNASGTAGLLELARILAPLRGQLPRGILFSSYAGEELGLLGSAAWVRQPTLPLDKAVAMINMDMIGRVAKNTIYIGGVGTAADFRSILEQGVAHSGLKAEYSQSGYSSSDHTSFVVKQIPVLFFFSGLHSDYHKPSDTWDKIDSNSGEARVRYGRRIASVRHRFRERLGIRAVLRIDSGLRPGGNRCSLLRCAPGLTRGEGGAQGRRRHDQVRRSTHQESLRLHRRPAWQQGRRRRGRDRASGRKTAHGEGRVGAEEIVLWSANTMREEWKDMNIETVFRRRSAVRPYLLAVCALVLSITSMGTAQTPAPSASADGKELPVHKIPNLGAGAEFYFSPDGTLLIGDAKREGDTSYHVYTLALDGTDIRRINDKGDDACSFYFPDGKRIIWTSSKDHPELANSNYSNPSDYPQGAELYTSNLDGGDVKRLTNNSVYDAEVSVAPNGKWILFGSQRSGKMELWKSNTDGSNAVQITHLDGREPGGAFLFLDGKTIIFRAWRTDDAKANKKGLPMDLFTIQSDGTDLKQLTHDGGTNWSPFPAADGHHYVFVKVLPLHNYEIFLGDLNSDQQVRHL